MLCSCSTVAAAPGFVWDNWQACYIIEQPEGDRRLAELAPEWDQVPPKNLPHNQELDSIYL